MNKKKKFILLGALVVVAAAGAGVARYWTGSAAARRLNVLVVSACSVRWDKLGFYNPESRLTPRLDAWAGDAVIFNNAVAELPWQNFSQHARPLINPEFLRRNRMLAAGGMVENHVIIPPLKRTAGGELYWGDKDILNYRDGVERLRMQLRRSSDAFYLFVHLKYMHFPHYDDLNMGPSEWSRLNPKSRDLLREYTGNPAAHEAKLPLIEFLLNDISLAKRLFNVQSEIFSTAGIVSDPSRTARWRATKGVEDDIRLARELYDLKMEKFDEHAAEVVNLFGDPGLQANTVVVFMGDHGEALMDHGMIGHSVNVYDEMVRYPLVVKFPGPGAAVRLNGQINHTVMAEIVKGMIDGSVTRDNLVAEAEKRSLEVAMSRNCMDNIRSARYRGEWKFIKNLVTGRNELYDLTKDPRETVNLADTNPEMAWKLDDFLMSHPITPSTSFGRVATAEAMVCNAN